MKKFGSFLVSVTISAVIGAAILGVVVASIYGYGLSHEMFSRLDKMSPGGFAFGYIIYIALVTLPFLAFHEDRLRGWRVAFSVLVSFVALLMWDGRFSIQWPTLVLWIVASMTAYRWVVLRQRRLLVVEW